jgi:hypothetical protein
MAKVIGRPETCATQLEKLVKSFETIDANPTLPLADQSAGQELKGKCAKN